MSPRELLRNLLRKSRFALLVIICQVRPPMDGAPSTRRIHKKGPGRKPDSEVTAATLCNRRSLDRKRRRKLVAAGVVPPSELHDHPLRKRGRPLLSDAALERPEHASARYQRKYRAAIARAKAQIELTAAVCILTQMTAVPAAEAEAERRAAEAQRKLRKLERQLAERNSEGRAGLLLKEASASGRHGPCMVCFEDVHTVTPCCSRMPDVPNWLCATCVKQAVLVYSRLPTNDSVRVDDGGPKPVPSEHLKTRCPVCRKDDVFANGVRALVHV